MRRTPRPTPGKRADEIGDSDGEKIARSDEAVHGLEADMVGVHVIGVLPAEGGDCGIGLGAEVFGPGLHEHVLAVGLVPDGMDGKAGVAGLEDGGELCLALMGKAIAHAKGVFFKGHIAGVPGRRSALIIGINVTYSRGYGILR
jgi:hypothetical protein